MPQTTSKTTCMLARHSALVSVLFLALQARGAIAQAPDLRPSTQALVNAIAKQQFSEVVIHFDDTMAAALPADTRASTWHSVITQAGEFKSITATRQTELQGYQVVFVSCHFAQHDLDAKIVHDAQGRVAELFLGPQAKAAAASGPGAKTAEPADLAGDWQGTLAVGAVNLRIVFHIKSAADGLHATIDSPDQSAYGLPVSSVQPKDGTVKLESERVKAVFEGTLSSDLSTLSGTWTQGAGSLPLSLKRVKNAAELERHPRPQEPRKPYPYSAESVTYDNKTAGNRLAATLTIPKGKGPFPAVVLITGSGPQDRDETVFNHKPFLVLADYLTRRGIAVLRADDRGTGESTGDFATATTADFATDTEAGIAYLKTRAEINPRQIGLIGHSEGGIIAPMIAARNHEVAFIVMMAGSGVPGDQILVAQSTLMAEAAGKSHEVALKTGERERELLDLLKQGQDDAALQKSLTEKLSAEMREAQIGAAVSQLMSPWFRYFVSYDPATALHQVTCPVLALNGEKDLQVPPKQNLPAIREALEDAGNKHFETDELPQLNHLFQTAKTGSVAEYAAIDETISPVALEKISGWILKSGLTSPN